MLGVIVNTITVILGSSLGLLMKKGISEKISKAAMTAIGLCTLYIGINGALQGDNTIVLILSMVFGVIIGTALNIDGKIGKLGSLIESKTKIKGEQGTVAQGFITASLLFCVGAMTIVGSLNAGLSGDNELLFTKSILDLISSCMLASSLGVGVIFAAAFVLIYQGGLVLLASLISNILTDTALINEITSAGSLMIIGLGLNLLNITKIKIADFLPALLLVPVFYYLIGLLPI